MVLLSLSPSFVNECFQGSILFALMIYFKFYFCSDYTRTCHIHINLSALLHICTHLTTVRIIINILVNSELNWKGMGKFSSDNHYIDYCGQEFHRKNGGALIIYKKFPNMHYLGATSTITEWYRVVSKARHSILQHSSPCPCYRCWRTWSWSVLWRPRKPTRTNTKNRCCICQWGLICQSRKSRDTWSNRQD